MHVVVWQGIFLNFEFNLNLKTFQQPLDITMPEDDEVYFSVSGDLYVFVSSHKLIQVLFT